MNTLGFAAIATGIIFFALFAKRLENTVITPPLVFAAFGLVIGDTVLGWADLKFEKSFIHGLAEITLILVLFSDAARIDLSLLRKDHNLPLAHALDRHAADHPLRYDRSTCSAPWLHPLGSCAAGGHPRADRRRPWPVGGAEPVCPGAYPADVECRERLE